MDDSEKRQQSKEGEKKSLATYLELGPFLCGPDDTLHQRLPNKVDHLHKQCSVSG